MRTEAEMMELILGFARRDARIRAVTMSGSRLNSNAPNDLFQDYDIIYFVRHLDEFVNDRTWIQQFGHLVIMQTPDESEMFPSSNVSFAFLMQFQDGNRMDLTLYPVDEIQGFRAESLSRVLLDKDNLLGTLPEPSNSDHRTVPPTKGQYTACCNEFWWVSTYVAKGIWRQELPYAKGMLEGPVRDMLHTMLTWYIGVKTGFDGDAGKAGKYFQRYLDEGMWSRFVRTFPDGDYKNIWDALFVMGDLFRELALVVGEALHYTYPTDDDERVTAYLRHVQALPPDAVTF